MGRTHARADLSRDDADTRAVATRGPTVDLAAAAARALRRPDAAGALALQATIGNRATIQRFAGGPARHKAPPRGRELALPSGVRAAMEGFFRADFSQVRVFEGSAAPAVGARAFTDGRDIHFAPGMFQPETRRGREVLGHELAHVVQQAQGRVRAGGRVGGVALNDSPALEAEASRLGAAAARGDGSSARAVAPPVRPGRAPVVQRFHEGTNGERVSERGDLVLLEPHALYADQKNLAGANKELEEWGAGVELMAGGTLKVESDSELLDGRAYVEVIPQARKLVDKQARKKAELAAKSNSVLAQMQQRQPHASSSEKSKQAKHNAFKQWIAGEAAKVKALARAMAAKLDEVLGDVSAMYDGSQGMTKQQWRAVEAVLVEWMKDNNFTSQFITEERMKLTEQEIDNPAAKEYKDKGVKFAEELPRGVTFKLFVYPSANDVRAFCKDVVARMDRLVAAESADALIGKLILPSDCNAAASLVSGGNNDEHYGDVPPIGGTHFVKLPESDSGGWQFHWAAVIMADGGDTVSLENAADPSKAPLDRTTWYFQMYGSKGDQTFTAQLRKIHAERNLRIQTNMEALHAKRGKNADADKQQ